MIVASLSMPDEQNTPIGPVSGRNSDLLLIKNIIHYQWLAPNHHYLPSSPLPLPHPLAWRLFLHSVARKLRRKTKGWQEKFNEAPSDPRRPLSPLCRQVKPAATHLKAGGG